MNRMNFAIDAWTFQLVLVGSRMILEGRQGDECISTELNPQASPRLSAYALLARAGA